MLCIRGTDFAGARVGDLAGVPLRHIEVRKAQRKNLLPWDILIEVAGGTKDQITGRTLLLRPQIFEQANVRMTCASFSRFVRVRRDLCDPEYVFWYLQYLYANGAMRAYHTQHTGVARFQWTTFADREPLHMPRVAEQRRIAGVLSAYDDLIENCERRIRVLDEMARTLYREWFVLFRYPGHEKTPLVDSTLGRIPQGWVASRLEQLAADVPYAINGGPFGSKLGTKDYVPNGVPVIRGSNLSENGRFRAEDFVFVSSEKANELNANLARPGDIVVTQRGTLGQSGRIPKGIGYDSFVISQSQMKLTLDEARIDTDYAFFALSSAEAVGRLKRLASSSGVPHINLATLREFSVLVPPLGLQRQFAAFAKVSESLIESLVLQRSQLASARDLLLPRLLSGQLSVEDAA